MFGQLTIRQNWVAEVGSGTSYGSHDWCIRGCTLRLHHNQDISSQDLRILQDRHDVPRGRDDYYHWLDLPSHADAYAKLHRTLCQPLDPQQQRAYSRLSQAWSIPFWKTTPDLYIKIFNDLDLVLFSGELYRRVIVSWADLRHRRGGPLAGLTRRRIPLHTRRRRIQILLEYDLYPQADKALLWGTLIHEMLHAYMDVVGESILGCVLNRALGKPHCDGGVHCEHFAAAARQLACALDFDGFRGRDISSGTKIRG